MNVFDDLRKDHDLQRELANANAHAEERHFYVPLMQHDLTQEKSRHGVAEHHALDELVEALASTDDSSRARLATARQLRHKAFHHLEEEEHEVFQLAGNALTDSRKDALAGAYRTEMNKRLDTD